MEGDRVGTETEDGDEVLVREKNNSIRSMIGVALRYDSGIQNKFEDVGIEQELQMTSMIDREYLNGTFLAMIRPDQR